MEANGDSLSTSVGFIQLILGSISQAQIRRSQLKRSNVLLKADASALRVLLTTLGIFLLDQATGQITDNWFWAIREPVVKMIVPCLEDNPFLVSKEASENSQKETSFSEIGTMTKVTGFFLVSSSTRFASRRSSTQAFGICDWGIPTLALMSGLVCTAAYWREPHITGGDTVFPLRWPGSEVLFDDVDKPESDLFFLCTSVDTSSQYFHPSIDGSEYHKSQTPQYWKPQMSTSLSND